MVDWEGKGHAERDVEDVPDEAVRLHFRRGKAEISRGHVMVKNVPMEILL